MERKPKPKLSEVLAALVSSVAQARSVADGEALRIACMYQQHELLRGLPAPRMRVTRVTVGLPVMITELVERTSAQRADVEAASAVMERGLLEEIERTSEHHASGRSPDPKTRSSDGKPDQAEPDRRAWEAFVQAFERHDGAKSYLRGFQHEYREQLAELDRTYGDPGVPEALVRGAAGDVAGDTLRSVIRQALLRDIEQRGRGAKRELVSTSAGDEVSRILDSRSVKRLIEHARSAAWSASLVTSAQDADLRVAVATEEIKNLGGGPEVVTRLQLTLLEEGLEWLTQNEDDGSKSWKLVTE